MSEPKPNLGTSGEAARILGRYMRRPRDSRAIPPKAPPKLPPAEVGEDCSGKIASTLYDRNGWTRFYWIPVRSSHQVIFAEALSQAIAAEVEILEAIHLAALANPSPRFRAAIRDLAHRANVGLSLEQGFRQLGVGVRPELLIALEVGEERGCLSEQLDYFSRRYDTHPGRRLAQALGHSDEVGRFAGVLADLLEGHYLTVSLFEDAIYLTGGRKSRFTREMLKVADDMRNGESLADALGRRWNFSGPSFFSRFACRLLEVASNRERMRQVLQRFSTFP